LTKNATSPLAFLSGARAALTFLTRIPFGCGPISPAALHWAPAWFPAIGLALGCVGWLVFLGLDRAGSWVAAASAVAVLALITGAFHEDGLADTADALGGAWDREKIFAILKDSRIGSFGATALTLVLLLRIAALAKLGPLAFCGLLLGQTLSRTTPVWLMAALPYVTPGQDARSRPLAGVRLPQVIFATGSAALISALLLIFHFVAMKPLIVAASLAVGVAILCGWRFYARAGGVTGDFLGATQQVTDVVVLVGLAASI
jgi:adenosylcobinamide-GDP ribazoletransferase